MKEESPTILLVDDDRSFREFLTLFLKKEGYQVLSAGDGLEALKILETEAPDLILLDLRMPHLGGLDFLGRIRKKGLEIPVIVITAYASLDSAVRAKKEGAFDYLPKPFKLEELRQKLKAALKRRPAPEPPPEEFMGIVGRSPAMRRIFTLLPKVAQAESNVLITGESGTGKELVAQAIHQLSPRREKPFVVVNCGGIPSSLLESELFGYKAGAFTGATRDKPGLFALADGGTIFLDEIGDLPAELQVKLLRVVENKSFTPLGSTREIRVDVRIISATNKDLEEEVRAGRFREDLYFRLNVLSLHLPPLRERREDIPLLVQHFLHKYARKLGREEVGISPYALKALMEYDFPGNVRELENIIERAVALETGPLILPESLTLRSGGSSRTELKAELPPGGLDLEAYLAEIEKDLLRQALERTGGRREEAARLLGLTPRSLRYRLQKYGLA
ncbi:sigma-54-dependent Fis family transcriptional regulator [Thermosulfurimonas marina]|uniref:Sigma-54-dependent Fis family transcriptional regulator n=1 Tax=Thermosulfurimonas marina TaxID=2047767 RepID=A0A6H1WUP0_9BACT|nr:sigma-54 dependent transcriptional regulator [Thermosulfurimonas marina]QJA06917.1 sigma-54-dependent Fis family transcriptional regulator [Thermosulfurimonas marina]